MKYEERGFREKIEDLVDWYKKMELKSMRDLDADHMNQYSGSLIALGIVLDMLDEEES